MTCPACAAQGRPGVPGVEEVAFRAPRLERWLGGRVEPVRLYAGTGFRLRRTGGTRFCAAHAPEARRLAAAGLTLHTALRRLVKRAGRTPYPRGDRDQEEPP